MSHNSPFRPLQDRPVVIGTRSDRSRWISVEHPDTGQHYQCDYDGPENGGPVSRDDFRYAPPEWVITLLGLPR